ncbi:hypothetical protein WA026_017516 [Henosepilachna vigintioctopunctata]|uniref:Prostaglandin reductase 1 n=1 Tax=Henosepilachna vigintioctopunctata TaxID=420089 RepID=A0AAW1V3Y8_9CUCU
MISILRKINLYEATKAFRASCELFNNKKNNLCNSSFKKFSSCQETITGRKYVIQNKFCGFPKECDLKIVEEVMPEPQEGQFLCESIFISVDPYQRAYEQNEGDVMIGSQVARVLISKNPCYPEGSYIVGYYGWKTHHVFDNSQSGLAIPTMIIPESLDMPKSFFLGVLGMPGVTANFGFLEICQPKPCETVIVTGAAGAVGSIVGQIAKIKNCYVIGVVGSQEKGCWITRNLGFDGYINYKEDDICECLNELAPNGIDCYFDNVGGEISSQILRHMNTNGRISVCGAISAYNSTEEEKATIIQKSMIFNELKMEGFLVTRWVDRWDDAVTENAQWLKEGKLSTRETVTKGFENTFKAFTDMLSGANFGKAIVEL